MARRFRYLVSAAVVAFLVTSAVAAADAPQPVVEGNRIVDDLTSKRFIPRGVNFPGFEYACQQGWDYGEAGTAPDEAAATVAAMAAWKINTVRLPLNQDCWLGDDGLPAGDLTADGYRHAVEDFVDALNDAGIVAIVDLHWSGPDGVMADGLRPMPDDRSPAFWYSVASRFKASRSVIFDLFNEPHSRWNANDTKVFGLGWMCWRDGGCMAPSEPDTAAVSGSGWYQTVGLSRLTSVVRDAGATQPVLLSGVDYANDLRGWREHAPDDPQLIAGFHNYTQQRCRTATCWDREIAPLAREVPVLAAEFGQNDCGAPDHVTRFMDWADAHSIGYLAWAWWVLPTDGCGNFSLVSDLGGTPLAPVGTALHDHLAELDAGRDPVSPGRGPDGVAGTSRRLPGLRIVSANWGHRLVRLRISINPLASFPVRLDIRLADRSPGRPAADSAARAITRRIPVRSGLERLAVPIPAGTKPKLIVVSFPGDQRFRPQTVRHRPGSVPGITPGHGRG